MTMVDLERYALEELIGLLDRGPDSTAPFAIHVVASSHPAAELGRHLERRVFGEAFGNTPTLLAKEYGPYDPASFFLLVVDHRRRVAAGAIRVIVPSPAGLKTLEDIRDHWGRPPDVVVRGTGVEGGTARLWDIATLVVDSQYRRAAARGLVSMALWQAVGVLAFRCQVDLLLAIMDMRAFRLLQSKLPGAFEGVAGLEPLEYLDSPASLPIYSRPEQWRSRMVVVTPEMVALMVEGRGLEDAVAPPDWDAAADTATRLAESFAGAKDS
jgi:hypothetical protein